MATSNDRERVLVVGGPLDGRIGEIEAEASRSGFFLYPEEGGDGNCLVYYAHETRDGFRVFHLGTPEGNTP